MEREKQEENEARRGGGEAQSPSPEMGRGSWAGSSQPQPAGKLRPGGFWPRVGRVWWPQHPSPFSCPGSPPLGRVTHLGKGRRRTVCVAGAGGPVKAPQLTVLLQEGGWAGLTFRQEGNSPRWRS